MSPSSLLHNFSCTSFGTVETRQTTIRIHSWYSTRLLAEHVFLLLLKDKEETSNCGNIKKFSSATSTSYTRVHTARGKIRQDLLYQLEKEITILRDILSLLARCSLYFQNGILDSSREWLNRKPFFYTLGTSSSKDLEQSGSRLSNSFFSTLPF